MHNLIYTYVLRTADRVFYNLHGIRVLSTSDFFFFGNFLLDKKNFVNEAPLHNVQISISTFFQNILLLWSARRYCRQSRTRSARGTDKTIIISIFFFLFFVVLLLLLLLYPFLSLPLCL